MIEENITNIKKSLSNGFAMLEVLISVLIISISVVGTLTLNNYLLRTSSNFKQSIQAVNLANTEIESLRSYSTIPTTAGQFAYNDILTLSTCSALTTLTFNGTTYTCTLSVSSSTSPAYATVTVTVSWTNNTSTNQSIQLISMIGAIDPNAIGQTIGTGQADIVGVGS